MSEGLFSPARGATPITPKKGFRGMTTPEANVVSILSKSNCSVLICPPAKSSGPLHKLGALIVTVALVGLVLMFSAVLLVIIMTLGTIAWAYLWWKSRELRKQMRDFHSRVMNQVGKVSDEKVFEGEVIRVVDSQNVRRGQ